jgi:Icc protein
VKVPAGHLPDGVYPLQVKAQDIDGREAEDSISVRVGAMPDSLMERHERDRDNALSAWPEHGLLATQLGPNKNGRKW